MKSNNKYTLYITIVETQYLGCTLRNYFYIDMDPLHRMSFLRLLARLDMDICPQNRCDGFPV